LVEDGARELHRRCPELPDLGACVFLGKHYARPDARVLFLGINPGASPNRFIDTSLCDHNVLIEGPNPAGHAYWTNARKFFNADPIVREVFDAATFAFCCPYRTTTWSGLAERQREVLTGVSRPVLRQVVTDCQPTLIVVAGVAGRDALVRTLPELALERREPGGESSGTYQWMSHRGRFAGRALVLVQVPHFSRANSSLRLMGCAAWMRGFLQPA
jgi:hypothetical protein